MNALLLALASRTAGFLHAACRLTGGGKCLAFNQIEDKLSFSVFRSVIPHYVKSPSVVGFSLCLCFSVLPLFMTSCEDYDDAPHRIMQEYLAESRGLDEVSTDSVQRFSLKVDEMVAAMPSMKSDPLYPQVQENIRQALLRVPILIEDGWGEDIRINFDAKPTDDEK